MLKQIIIYSLFALLLSCNQQEQNSAAAEIPEIAGTPVTVTNVSTEPLSEYVDLNATSVFLQSNAVKASANGYIQQSRLQLNQYVTAGQLAFTLKTKEAKALGNTINVLDSSFRFSGMINIPATASGYVSQLNVKPGDYVQDGEQLAAIIDAKSFGFLLSLPYELLPYLPANKVVDLELPDKTILKGNVNNILPVLDSASQTLTVKISVQPKTIIPQNLIAKVRIVKMAKAGVITLPKTAVLSDEALQNFWVMQMIDSVTAVKVPITKGAETNNRVEIISPRFSAADKIVLTGNYGLADTARVVIVNPEP